MFYVCTLILMGSLLARGTFRSLLRLFLYLSQGGWEFGAVSHTLSAGISFVLV